MKKNIYASLILISSIFANYSHASTSLAIIPNSKKVGDIVYTCGGIGEIQSKAMTKAMKDYPLSLLFVEKNGAYLADINVEIIKNNHSELSFNAGGPICLINLPEGDYKINATLSNGISKSKNIMIDKNSQTVEFVY